MYPTAKNQLHLADCSWNLSPDHSSETYSKRYHHQHPSSGTNVTKSPSGRTIRDVPEKEVDKDRASSEYEDYVLERVQRLHRADGLSN